MFIYPNKAKQAHAESTPSLVHTLSHSWWIDTSLEAGYIWSGAEYTACVIASLLSIQLGLHKADLCKTMVIFTSFLFSRETYTPKILSLMWWLYVTPVRPIDQHGQAGTGEYICVYLFQFLQFIHSQITQRLNVDFLAWKLHWHLIQAVSFVLKTAKAKLIYIFVSERWFRNESKLFIDSG